MTGLNDAFIINEETRQNILDNCKTKDERERTDQIIRPILRGRDIKRNSYMWAGLYVLFIPWHFPCHEDGSITGASMKAEELFSEQYGAVHNHLLQFKSRLEKRNQSETGIRYEWYTLQRWGAKYSDDFNKQKIIFPAIMSKNALFAKDDDAYIVIAPGNIITSETINLDNLLKYLCSIGYWALRNFYMGGGIEGELKVNRLLLLPVPENIDEISRTEDIYSILELTSEEIKFISASENP